MQKILLFGNGIFIRYAPKYYDPKRKTLQNNLKENLLERMNDHLSKYFYMLTTPKIRQRLMKKFYQEVEAILAVEKINETTLWKLYIEYIITFNANYRINTVIREHIADNKSDDKISQKVMKKIRTELDNKYADIEKLEARIKNDPAIEFYPNFLESLKTIWSDAYKAIIYGIALSVCCTSKGKNKGKHLPIDPSFYNNYEIININYSSLFRKKLNEYDEIHTTNYYVGKINDHYINFCTEETCLICTKFKFIHGKIKLNKKMLETSEYKSGDQVLFESLGADLTRPQIQDDKILVKYDILFGKTFADKNFLSRLMQININEPIINEPTRVDIVGLSTTSDEPMLARLFKSDYVKEVNIYCHTNEDEISYKNLIKKISKNNPNFDAKKIKVKSDSEFFK